MQPREAFKIGFMARCIEEELSHEKTAELMEKAAIPVIDKLLTVAGKAALPAAALAVATPPSLGGLAAYFNNKAMDTDTTDIEEIKQKELVDSYERMAQQLRQRKKLRERQAKRNEGKRQIFL